jgi:type III secretion system low calcium response chaperone LcrH/SycD
MSGREIMETIEENHSQEMNSFFHEMIQTHFPDHSTLQEACGLSNASLNDVYRTAYDLYSAGNGLEAARYFAALVTFSPFQGKFWIGLGASQHLDKQYEKALQAYSVAALLDGRDPAPHYHAAQCYFALGNTQDGLKALDLAEAHASSNPIHSALRNRITSLKETLLTKGQS